VKTAAPKVSEDQVQQEIVRALQMAGYHVDHTTAYRQRGPSGVSRGIPDLLVSHALVPGVYLGVEVKRPGRFRYSSTEQQLAAESGRFFVAQSAAQAVSWCHANLVSLQRAYGHLEGNWDAAIGKSRRMLAALAGE